MNANSNTILASNGSNKIVAGVNLVDQTKNKETNRSCEENSTIDVLQMNDDQAMLSKQPSGHDDFNDDETRCNLSNLKGIPCDDEKAIKLKRSAINVVPNSGNEIMKLEKLKINGHRCHIIEDHVSSRGSRDTSSSNFSTFIGDSCDTFTSTPTTSIETKTDPHMSSFSDDDHSILPGGDTSDEEDNEVIEDILSGRLDRYGFATMDNTPLDSPARSRAMVRDRQTYWSKIESKRQWKKRVRLENLRLRKWIRIVEHWDVYKFRKRSRLDRRLGKGIPDGLREKVWPLLVDLPYSKVESKEEVPSFKNLILAANESTNPEMEKVFEAISRDISRTFPRHIAFYKRGGVGQNSLTNVLRAYASLDPEVGYCQGMGFIVGLFLAYLPERKSFELFQKLMQDPPWNMAEVYKAGMPGSQRLLEQYRVLFLRFEPSLAAHLETEGVVPSMYATHWFVTVFTYNFPFEMVCPIFDLFLSRGWPIIHSVAIAIVRLYRHELRKLRFESILEFFRDLPPALKHEEVMTEALSLNITQRDLDNITSSFVK